MPKKMKNILLFLSICIVATFQVIDFSSEVGIEGYASLPIIFIEATYLEGYESITSTDTKNNTMASQAIYTTSTIVNTTTTTLVETTGPIFREGPLVIYDVEFFFEENDTIKIETSSGARVHINPDLEEVEREDWTRIYVVYNSGNYKIRVTTGHYAERLFVNIYRISLESSYVIITLQRPTYLTSMESVTSVNETATELKRTETTNFTITTPRTTDTVEAIPGYGIDTIVYGILIAVFSMIYFRLKKKKARVLWRGCI